MLRGVNVITSMIADGARNRNRKTGVQIALARGKTSSNALYNEHARRSCVSPRVFAIW